jgi:hypothetical protein
MSLAIGLVGMSVGPAHADESVPDTASAVFECPPLAGIYPEPDPCVPTPQPPDLPEFSTTLDPWPFAPDWYCEPETKPGVVAFRGVLRSHYDIGGSTSRDCDVTWSYEFSYHKMGLALDWRVDATDPYGWASGLSLLRWLLATDSEGNEFAIARRIGITQLIWHNRIWSAHNPTWRIYCDPRDDSGQRCISDPTARHDDHMHISFSLESGYLHTTFFGAMGLEPIVIPPPPVPANEEEPQSHGD